MLEALRRAHLTHYNKIPGKLSGEAVPPEDNRIQEISPVLRRIVRDYDPRLTTLHNNDKRAPLNETLRNYQPQVLGPPLNGPMISLVIQPP